MKKTLNPGSEFLVGQNNFVMYSNNNDTEVPEDQPEELALQLKVKDFAYRSKAKAKKTKRRELDDYSPSIIPMNERNGIDIEPGNYCLSAYEVSKKVFFDILKKVQREYDGAVHLWRIKEHLLSQFPWSDNRWKAWQQEEEQKGDTSTALIFQKQLFISELFKDIQDAILLILHYRTMW